MNPLSAAPLPTNPTGAVKLGSWEKPSLVPQVFWDLMSTNPYLQAGAGVYAMTVLGMGLRSGLKAANVAVRRRFIVSLETTSADPSYLWLMQWLSNHPTFHFQQMSVISSEVTIHANEEKTTQSTFAPCPGVPHYMLHKGWPIVVNRRRQLERAMGSEVLETIELTTIGTSGKFLQEIMMAANHAALQKDSDRTVIYHNGGNRWMRRNETRSRRPLSSVVLQGTIREDLVRDVRVFLQSKDYYTKLGVPYRRGYLLFGPPGCGKSSVVMALAGELRLAICVMSLSNRSLDDESLNTLLNEAPAKALVLLEDIDRAFTADSRVTMSGLLNALDGVAAQEGRIVFMTTNHVERLDPALIRPGRADVKVEIGLMNSHQMKEMFAKFFPDATDSQRERFVSAVGAEQVSPAQLQSHLFEFRDSPETAIERMPKFLSSVRSFERHLKSKADMEQRIKNIQPPPML